jgi:UPF0755 protein
MRRVALFFVLVILAAAGLVAWAAWALQQPYQNFPASGVFVDVPRGASRRTIGRLLENQGVIRNRLLFEALSRYRSKQTLEAGEYFFNEPASTVEVFEKIANGRIYVRELVIPEGYTTFQIAELVEQEGLTTRDDFLAAARNSQLVRSFAPDAPSLEGFLFPATYLVPRHLSGQEIVTEMVKRFQQEWQTLSSQPHPSTGLSTKQVVTLASLVESETPKPEERPIVAGVFLNRLQHGIPLQCDPTVAYALELAGQFSGKLEAADLRFDSNYNTYRRTGLPPGPIANPGEMSLQAALNPAQTDLVYFVANAEGGHVFSKTLAEHNRNVAHYREVLAQQRKQARIASSDQLAGEGGDTTNTAKPAREGRDERRIGRK